MEDLRKMVLKKFKENFQGNWPTATEYEKNELIDYLHDEIDQLIFLEKNQIEHIDNFETQIKTCLGYPEEKYNKLKLEITDKYSDKINEALKTKKTNLEDIKKCNSGVYTKYLIFYHIISFKTGIYYNYDSEIRKAIQKLNDGNNDTNVIEEALAPIIVLQEVRNFKYPEKLKTQLDANYEKYEDVCEA